MVPNDRAMKPHMLSVGVLCLALLTARGAAAQIPTLPDGARTRWVIDDPEEIVGWLTFDPATVADRIPRYLRFITVGELATGGVGWATAYLADHPAHGEWGISFFEIVRMETFAIDGRSPDWPPDGAAALWFARVAATDPSTDLGAGLPLLALEFWIPDAAYTAYMLGRGHYATAGDVRLARDDDGELVGSVSVVGLTATVRCTPIGPITGGADSAGAQVFFPPASSDLGTLVRVAFAGHREQRCGEVAPWNLSGTHPLARGVLLAPPTLQFGYRLVGGAYGR